MTSLGEMRLALTSPSYNKFDCGKTGLFKHMAMDFMKSE